MEGERGRRADNREWRKRRRSVEGEAVKEKMMGEARKGEDVGKVVLIVISSLLGACMLFYLSDRQHRGETLIHPFGSSDSIASDFVEMDSFWKGALKSLSGGLISNLAKVTGFWIQAKAFTLEILKVASEALSTKNSLNIINQLTLIDVSFIARPPSYI
ncbi:hypothetical protein QJS10_CPA07g01301 [Acorus calamus]|uniref:Uncharacterized protein n=1 Tax=Acorus calamus TaxID=4465 RepID=A0AAV9EHR1_ACOCL|nr:hypothetical protein QJS10_CPA07g01301 [Acorus calamus]